MDIQDVEDAEEVDRTPQREQGQGESRQGRAEKPPAGRASGGRARPCTCRSIPGPCSLDQTMTGSIPEAAADRLPRVPRKRKGCWFQETGFSISAVPSTGPVGVTNISFTRDSRTAGLGKESMPPVSEMTSSCAWVRWPSSNRSTAGVMSDRFNRGARRSERRSESEQD